MTTRYELHDERHGIRGRRERITLDLPDSMTLEQLLAQYKPADFLTIYRRTPRGGWLLLRKGKGT